MPPDVISVEIERERGNYGHYPKRYTFRRRDRDPRFKSVLLEDDLREHLLGCGYHRVTPPEGGDPYTGTWQRAPLRLPARVEGEEEL